MTKEIEKAQLWARCCEPDISWTESAMIAMDEWAKIVSAEKDARILELESQINGMRKDTEMWVQRELGLEDLVWKAFFLSVCDLPQEEQLKQWDEFKKEHDFKPLYR